MVRETLGMALVLLVLYVFHNVRQCKLCLNFEEKIYCSYISCQLWSSCNIAEIRVLFLILKNRNWR